MNKNETIGFSILEYLHQCPDLKEAKNKDHNFDLKKHFDKFGIQEGRHLQKDLKIQAEKCLITNSGYILISGWLVDVFRRISFHDNPRFKLKLRIGFYEFDIPISSIIRYYRGDVNQAFNIEGDYDLGFFLIYKIHNNLLVSNNLKLIINVETAELSVLDLKVTLCSPTKFLNHYFTLLKHLLEINGGGFGACLNAYDIHGEDVISCWQEHVKNSRKHSFIKLGGKLQKNNFSLITVLYGTADLLKSQFHLLFSHAAKLSGEVILVSNSQEIHNQVLTISHYAQKLYSLNIKLILLADNVGFSEANNIAVSFAETENIVLVNPDIFPSNLTNWRNFIQNLEIQDCNKIIAPFLHYSDGSVMHSGMSFHKDEIFFIPKNTTKTQFYLQKQYSFVLRIDHPHKGHLITTFANKNCSPKKMYSVEAISGGFMFIKRKLFEMIGGFSTKYIFGHFEDADLCLKARNQGATIMCDPNLSFVHLEGKGSKSSDWLASSGSKIFNQCHFTRSHETLF